MSPEKKKILMRSLLLTIAAVALLAGGVKLIEYQQQKQYQEARSAGTDEFMQSGTVVWEGKKYRKTPGLTTLLIAGIDALLSGG